MQSFTDFSQSFADLSGISQKNADNFFSASVLWGGGQHLKRPNVMTDISEFQNFEYTNNETLTIRLFYFWIYFLFLRFFELLKYSKYIYDKLPN